jgi:hypothetical protein
MTASNDVAVPLHSLSAARDWMPDFHHIRIHALSSVSVVTDNGREPVIPYGTTAVRFAKRDPSSRRPP